MTYNFLPDSGVLLVQKIYVQIYIASTDTPHQTTHYLVEAGRVTSQILLFQESETGIKISVFDAF